MTEKEVVAFFHEVYPNAKDGPAKCFFDNTHDEQLELAYVKVEYACMNKKGQNPYRANMVEEMKAHDFYKDVPLNELEATRALLVMLAKAREATPKASELRAALAGTKVELAKVLDGDNQKKE